MITSSPLRSQFLCYAQNILQDGFIQSCHPCSPGNEYSLASTSLFVLETLILSVTNRSTKIPKTNIDTVCLTQCTITLRHARSVYPKFRTRLRDGTLSDGLYLFWLTLVRLASTNILLCYADRRDGWTAASICKSLSLRLTVVNQRCPRVAPQDRVVEQCC